MIAPCTWEPPQVKKVHAFLCFINRSGLDQCDEKKSLHLQKQMPNGCLEQPTLSSPDFKSGTSDTPNN